MRDWWQRRKVRRLQERAKRPCGQWSPGLVGNRCERPFAHTGQHEYIVSLTIDGFGREIQVSCRTWGVADKEAGE